VNNDQSKDLNEHTDKELDNFFDEIGNTNFKKAIKKAKWYSILRTALISLVVIALVIFFGSIINYAVAQKMEGRATVQEFNYISSPNKYIGKVDRYYNFLGGKNEYSTYKIIEGKVVYTGHEEYYYGLFNNDYGNWIGSGSPYIIGHSFRLDDAKIQKYNELGQREMIFYYPFINYPEYRNDLQLLDNVGSDKNMEMAISFDKYYKIEEVNQLLPSNITISWYWIDDLNKEEKENSEYYTSNDEINYSNPRLRSERTAYGIKAYNENGEKHENPELDFFRALEVGIKNDTKFSSEFERVYDNITGADGKLREEDLRVLGVVVTGSTEELKSLKDLSFVKASSLGVITDKY